MTMRRFAALYAALDATNSTRAKLAALSDYFRGAQPHDAAWAVFLLSGGRPRQAVPTRFMWQLAAEIAGVPEWLFAECYAAVGDFAETVAHLLPDPGEPSELPLAQWVETRLMPLRGLTPAEQRARLTQYWRELDERGRFVWNKLITGNFRVGVSRQLVIRALAEIAGIDAKTMAERLAGSWTPSAEAYLALLDRDAVAARTGQPYPFFLAYPLEAPLASLGAIGDWQAEWKWDGIRAQLIRRDAGTFLWSRGEELITERFPEILRASEHLPGGVVLDGEILAWRDGRPLTFGALQTRIGRRTLTPRVLEQSPAAFVVYDILEALGEDVRTQPLHERRAVLERVLVGTAQDIIMASPLIAADSWAQLETMRSQARARGVEGIMLKRRDAPYGTGRVRGPWWKWKIEPYSVDAVLVYAQRGHGRRASLYTDYTFAVWHDGELVPFAKAYSGLTDAEIRSVDQFIRNHTREKFGPVRSVTPQLVCEIGFEGIQPSKRHRAGIAVRFPRILRLRTDKTAEQADTLDRLRALLHG
jgi:DNA ligase-1